MTNSLRRVFLARMKRSTNGIAAGFVLALFTAHVGTGGISWAQTPKLAAGGPSTSAPRNLLVPNFPESSDALRDEAATLFERVYERQDQAAESAGVDSYEEVYVDLLRLRWLGDRLRLLGEQAGIDIINRVDALDVWINAEVKAASMKPELKREVTRRVVSIERAHELADKKLSRRIDDMYEDKEYIDAFEAYNEVTAPVEAQGLWYEAVKGEKHSLLERWNSTRKKYLFPAQKQAKDLAAQSRLAVYRKFDIDAASLIRQIAEAVKTLKTAPQIPLPDGQMITGPEALGHFTQGWVELQNKAVRAAGYRQIARYSSDSNPPNIDPKTYAGSCQDILANLTALIEADTERASGDEAADLYDAYLDKLPPLLSRCTSVRAPAMFDAALEKLAAKSQPLQDRIEAYHALTDDLLRWRHRAAAAYARSVAAEFPKPESPGTLVKLRAPIPEIVTEVSAKYLDKQVTVNDFAAIESGTANKPNMYAVSEMSDRLVFSTAIPHPQLEAVGAAFRAETLAVEIPPPTLAMRLTLYRLETGDFQSCGGTVTRVGIIGVPACYLTIQDDNRGLIRLGSLQVGEDDVQNIDLMLQCMLSPAPAWVTDTYWYAPQPTN